MKVRAVFAIAQLYVQQNKFDQAIVMLREQLEALTPGHWLRAEAQQQIDQANASRIAIAPRNNHEHLIAANNLIKQGNYPAAAAHFQKVIEGDPTLIQDGSAVAYAFREAQALAALVTLIEKIDIDGQALPWLTHCAAEIAQHDPKLAVRVYQRLRPTSTGPGAGE